MLRFETAGESHGQCLVATLTGLPAGIPISLDFLNRELWRRQQGYGRGGGMKIENDCAGNFSRGRQSKTNWSPHPVLPPKKECEKLNQTPSGGGIGRPRDTPKTVTRAP